MNRRDWLKSTVAVAAAAQSGVHVFAQEKRRRVGLIGCGWYGKIDLLRLIQVAPVEVVSLCDVDRNMLGNAAEIVASRQQSKKKPRTFSDYREMLKAKDLDIVLVAPPDHWHALIMIEAVKSGADVYVQKPISVDVNEGRAMAAAAQKYGRVVQVGLQRRSTPHIVEAKETLYRYRGAGQDCAGRYLLLLPHAGNGKSARHRSPGESRLRDVDRSGSDAAL